MDTIAEPIMQVKVLVKVFLKEGIFAKNLFREKKCVILGKLFWKYISTKFINKINKIQDENRKRKMVKRKFQLPAEKFEQFSQMVK